MKTITTTYKQTAKHEPETVYWLPSLNSYFSPSINHNGFCYLARELQEFLKGLEHNRHTFYWQAVTVKDIPEHYTREIYRGYTKYQDTKKIMPIVIRGRELGEVSAEVHQYQHGTYCSFNGGYSDPLSDGERKKLKEWFSQSLIDASTPELITELKAIVREKAIMRANQFIHEHIKEAQNQLNIINEIK